SRPGTEPIPLPTICRRAERSAAEGIAASGPATEPLWIQGSGATAVFGAGAGLDPGQGRAAVLAGGEDLDHRADRGRSPHVVDHDVDVRRAGEVVERVRLSRADLREARGVAAGGDHLLGAEALGDLDGQAARVAG